MKHFAALLFLFGYMGVGYTQRCSGESCPPPCPEGEYRYSIGCDYRQPQPTCKNPNPEKDTGGMVCDYSACYCNPPTVRDEESNKCVELADCPGNCVPTGPDPVKPKDPVTPVKPVKPKDPVTPVKPVKPKVPVTPVKPVKPKVPVTPVKPVKPKVPVTPIDPVTPKDPVAPREPVLPNLPDPATPSYCD